MKMESQIYAPIIIPTLNRYSHLSNLIESLKVCKGADKTELIIGLDYPPSEKYIEGFKRVKELIQNISGFYKVTILEAEINLGPVKNAEKLVEYVKKCGYKCYIFLEDDNVVAPAFLSYMNWALSEFENASNIISICGFRRDIPVLNYKNNIYESKLFRPYGFGIWLNKDKARRQRMSFVYLESEVRSMPFTSIFNIKKIRRASTDLYFLKKRIYHEDFCTNRFLEDTGNFCIVSVKPLVRNLGSEGSGIHGKNLDVYQSELSKVLDESLEFIPLVQDSVFYTPETVNADLIEKKGDMIEDASIKRHLIDFIKNSYHRAKFIIFRLTGYIISCRDY